ncbi:Protocadherin-11 X-Linked [Manis pentadactyla]|nr:Protocadherin-11 X-Linked [Manis pentadactyla]
MCVGGLGEEERVRCLLPQGPGEAGVKGKHQELLHRGPASSREVREPLYLSHPGPLGTPHPLLSGCNSEASAFEVPSLLTAPCISDSLPPCLPACGTCCPWPQPRNPSTGQQAKQSQRGTKTV